MAEKHDGNLVNRFPHHTNNRQAQNNREAADIS
jgi:hypothetical protein